MKAKDLKPGNLYKINPKLLGDNLWPHIYIYVSVMNNSSIEFYRILKLNNFKITDQDPWFVETLVEV